MTLPLPKSPRQLALALSTVIAALAAPGVQAQSDTTRVIVAFKPAAHAGARQAITAARGNVRHEIHGMDEVAIEVPAQALAGLSRTPHIDYVEEEVKRDPFGGTTPTTGTPYATGRLMPYGIAVVQADQLARTNAASCKVCIIDSGYDRSQEDLSCGANVISMPLGGAASSRTEDAAVARLLSTNGILSIAAAGHDGNTRTSHPAGYASVVSAAAVDENRQLASFSQRNKEVELAGPRVDVLSTVPMGTGSASALTVGTSVYQPGGMDGSPRDSSDGLVQAKAAVDRIAARGCGL